MGAYLSTFGPAIPTVAGTGVLASVYGFKAVYANVIGVFTNTVPGRRLSRRRAARRATTWSSA